jgi:hypothetical protein
MGNTSPGYEVVVTARSHRGGEEIDRKYFIDRTLAYLAACCCVDIYAEPSDDKATTAYAKLRLLEDGFVSLTWHRIEVAIAKEL